MPDHVRTEAETPFDGEVARQRRRLIVARAEAEGFDAVAVTPARLPETVRRDLGLFLDQGRQGDMAWMAETRARRGDPRVLWPELRSRS